MRKISLLIAPVSQDSFSPQLNGSALLVVQKVCRHTGLRCTISSCIIFCLTICFDSLLCVYYILGSVFCFQNVFSVILYFVFLILFYTLTANNYIGIHKRSQIPVVNIATFASSIPSPLATFFSFLQIAFQKGCQTRHTRVHHPCALKMEQKHQIATKLENKTHNTTTKDPAA